jgi:hypothetical protein
MTLVVSYTYNKRILCSVTALARNESKRCPLPDLQKRIVNRRDVHFGVERRVNSVVVVENGWRIQSTTALKAATAMSSPTIYMRFPRSKT